METNTKINISTISQQVLDCVRLDDIDTAKQLYSLLKVEIQNSKGSNSELLNLMYLLQFERLLVISNNQLFDLVEKHLTLLIPVADYSLLQKLQLRADTLEDDNEVEEFLDNIIKALSKNQESLSDQTIASWLTSYKGFPSKSALRSEIDEVNFVSNKANKLDSPQKTFLVKLLHLYDEIQNWLTVYRALPEVTDENELAKDFDIYRQIPGMRDELAELDQANPSPASRANSIDGVRVAKPVISQVAPAPLPVSRVSLPKIQETGESEPNAMQKTLQEIERAKANPEIVGRLDELLKKAKPVQVEPTKPQANPQPQNPQIDIDAKLEELKKRVGK